MTIAFLAYDVIMRVYAAMIRVAAFFNPKAKLWWEGRKNWLTLLQEAIPPQGVGLWMHCASLGEFEQGRPVLEAFKAQYPDQFILLTFFSPSGYEVRKNYPIADHISYLPLDTRKNASQFIKTIHPRLAIFVKYEFWLHHLTDLHQKHIPTLLISAIFRPGQIFFKWYGVIFKKLLHYYDQIFVQDETSAQLLEMAGIRRVTVSGDTRFDRVAAIANAAHDIEGIADFLNEKEAWVAGSTWPPDEQIIQEVQDMIPKWIIAPHEISEAHLMQIEKRFAEKTVRYSVLKTDPGKYTHQQILIIDNVGMLSSLYQYGVAAYIGGGFGKGIHNVLEAAVWGIPVVFGPEYHKFKETEELIQCGAGFSISNAASFQLALATLKNSEKRAAAGKAAADYVQKKIGATGNIIRYAAKKRFFTN